MSLGNRLRLIYFVLPTLNYGSFLVCFHRIPVLPVACISHSDPGKRGRAPPRTHFRMFCHRNHRPACIPHCRPRVLFCTIPGHRLLCIAQLRFHNIANRGIKYRGFLHSPVVRLAPYPCNVLTKFYIFRNVCVLWRIERTWLTKLLNFSGAELKPASAHADKPNSVEVAPPALG